MSCNPKARSFKLLPPDKGGSGGGF